MEAKSRSLEDIKNDIARRAGRINPFERVDRKEVEGTARALNQSRSGFMGEGMGQARRALRSQCRRAGKTRQKRGGGSILPSLRILSHRPLSGPQQSGKNKLLSGGAKKFSQSGALSRSAAGAHRDSVRG